MAAATPIIVTEKEMELIQVRVDPLVQQAEDYSIESQEDYERAAIMLRRCKDIEKSIRDEIDPKIKLAHDAHKGIVALRTKFLDPIAKAESIIKRKIGAYVEEQQRRAEEKRRRMEAEARKAEEERRLREAEEHAARGDEAAAEEVISAPIALPSVKVEEKPTAKGVSTGWSYSARVVDAAALIRAAAEGKVPAGMVIPNEKAIGALARSLKEGFSLPGVELVKTPSVSARSN